jgi:hypothetical protein
MVPTIAIDVTTGRGRCALVSVEGCHQANCNSTKKCCMKPMTIRTAPFTHLSESTYLPDALTNTTHDFSSTEGNVHGRDHITNQKPNEVCHACGELPVLQHTQCCCDDTLTSPQTVWLPGRDMCPSHDSQWLESQQPAIKTSLFNTVRTCGPRLP